MIVCKCLEKFRDKHGRVTGYRLMDIAGRVQDCEPEPLKLAIKNKDILVINLSLTSDNRLIDVATKSKEEIQQALGSQIIPVAEEERIGLATEIKTELERYGIDILKEEEKDNCLILKLNALLEYKPTVLLIDKQKSKAIWHGPTKNILGQLHEGSVSTDMLILLRTHDLYKKIHPIDDGLAYSVMNLIDNYRDFLYDWNTEIANNWGEEFGLKTITTKLATLLNVEYETMFNCKLRLTTYKKLAGNGLHLYCNNKLISVTPTEIRALNQEIITLGNKNKELTHDMAERGNENSSKITDILGQVEEKHDVFLSIMPYTEDEYPYNGGARITYNDAYYNVERSSLTGVITLWKRGSENASIDVNAIARTTGNSYVNAISKLLELA